MSPARPTLVVFDLIGTTVRDRGEVQAAFQAAFEAHGSVIGPATVARWRGAAKRVAIREAVRESEPHLDEPHLEKRVDKIYDAFREDLIRRLSATPDLPFPNALPTFERLRDAGMRLALNTGFDRVVAHAVLDATHWPPELFDAVVTDDDVDEGRPAPDMIHVAMECVNIRDGALVAVVGDTRLDLEAGFNAGAGWCIGVLTGAHDRAMLEQAPFTHIVASVGDVPGLWVT